MKNNIRVLRLRKNFFILFFLFILLLIPSRVTAQTPTPQPCIPNTQSCDQTVSCCNFPDYLCQGGYCTQATSVCGKPPYPCCDPPNPQCANSYICLEGYCSLPPTPTPTCGMHGQHCCSTSPVCRISGEICIAGFCYPETTTCGDPGQNCCLTPPLCRMPNTVCSNPTNPANGSCVFPTTTQPTTSPISSVQIPKYLDISGILPGTEITKWSNVGDIVSRLLIYIFPIAGILTFIYLLLGGFSLIFASGDPEKIKKAQGQITNAIIGFLIIFAAYWIVQVLEIILGVQLL